MAECWQIIARICWIKSKKGKERKDLWRKKELVSWANLSFIEFPCEFAIHIGNWKYWRRDQTCQTSRNRCGGTWNAQFLISNMGQPKWWLIVNFEKLDIEWKKTFLSLQVHFGRFTYELFLYSFKQLKKAKREKERDWEKERGRRWEREWVKNISKKVCLTIEQKIFLVTTKYCWLCGYSYYVLWKICYFA